MSDSSITIDDLRSELQGARDEFLAALSSASDEAELYALQVRFLGKKGSVTALRKQMGKLAPDQRKDAGQAFNAAKDEIEAGLETRRKELETAARERNLARREDLTMARAGTVGTLHPITHTRRALERIFRGLGFDVATGPHVEHEQYNFDALNIAPDHPARDMADTFFVESGPEGGDVPLCLRTHTSPVQIRTMLARKPPIRIVAPGTVFRRDDDATHSPMFNQIEGLYVDRGVDMADLKATLYRFVEAFFGERLEVRFRPSYFPFVEPGAEFDVQSPFGEGWMELGGSGMVHPEVLRAGGIDPDEFQGWAFGFGIDRMAMLRYGVSDLRHFFSGDQRFLEPFTC